MTTDRELMQWALAALDGYARNCKCEGGGAPCDAAEALRARLAKPEQKPAGWLYKGEVRLSARDLPPDETIPLYTTPPKIFCGCGDQIMPDDGAECGTCVTARNAVKQEPVAWRGINWSNSPDEYAYRDYDDPLVNSKGENVGEPLYTSPPQREWQWLTDEEIAELWLDTEQRLLMKDFARAIEVKLKDKNEY